MRRVDIGDGKVHVDRHVIAKLLTPRCVYAAQTRSTIPFPVEHKGAVDAVCEDASFVSRFGSTALSEGCRTLERPKD